MPLTCASIKRLIVLVERERSYIQEGINRVEHQKRKIGPTPGISGYLKTQRTEIARLDAIKNVLVGMRDEFQ